jgi:hypothetical protein
LTSSGDDGIVVFPLRNRAGDAISGVPTCVKLAKSAATIRKSLQRLVAAGGTSCAEHLRMSPTLDAMTDPDRPVTRRELREELEDVLRTLATKEDFKAFATKEDLKLYATKEDLKAFATKEDLKAFATKEDLKLYATKEDLKAHPTREEMNRRFDELRTHFDVVAESFKSEFRNLHDWVEANTKGLAKRIDKIETEHGARLLGLETRMSRREARTRRK